MCELTKEQEDMIHDLPHHDKKIEGAEKKKSFRIIEDEWINKDLLHQIRINIGREKHDSPTDSTQAGKGQRNNSRRICTNDTEKE